MVPSRLEPKRVSGATANKLGASTLLLKVYFLKNFLGLLISLFLFNEVNSKREKNSE